MYILFLSEFEEVCSMKHFLNIFVIVVHMKLILFSLQDSAKHWMYSLVANSISFWDDFVKLFFKKYFPNAKTAKLMNEINSFAQLGMKSF